MFSVQSEAPPSRSPRRSPELSGHGSDGDVSMLSLIKAKELFRQSMLRLECDGDDLGWLPLSAAIQDESCARIVTIVPGGLDQKSADMDVAGFGDRSPMLSVTGGMLRGDKPEVGHELARRGEARDVIDLTDNGEGSEDLDAAQTAERFDLTSIER